MSDFYLVVLDIGQAITKIGFGGESEPRIVFPTITGKTKYRGTGMETVGSNELVIGDSILDKIGMYKINYPINETGEIIDWNEYKSIIIFAFESIGVPISSCQILFAFNPFMSIPTHQRIAQLFLNEFEAGGYYPIRNALLSFSTTGKETSLVVDIGSYSTRITPIYKGYILKHAIQTISIGGSSLDNVMMRELAQRGKGTYSKGYLMKARQVKEESCFVSLNTKKDLIQPDKFLKQITYPDSSKVTVDSERFIVPEQLFQPVKQTEKQEKLVDTILECIEKCDVDIRLELLHNIILTGGTSSIPLLDARLQQEIEKVFKQRGNLVPPINVKSVRKGLIANWIGGANIIMLPSFQSKWLTRQSYLENGLPEDLMAI